MDSKQMSLWQAQRNRAHLAATLLRFRGVLGAQKGGEAALHAPQSRELRPGSGVAGMGLEQLPPLRLRRIGSGGGERTAESGVAGQENLLMPAAGMPTLRTPRSVGQPIS
jgi:hypothetical protein